MTILLFGNTSWSMFNFRSELIRKLVADGHDVCVAAPRDDYSKNLEALGARYFEINIDRSGVNPLKDFVFCLRIFKLYLKLSPQLIIHYTIKPNLYGSAIASLFRIPSIAVTTGLGHVFSQNTFTAKLIRFFYKLALKHPRHVLFLNKEDMGIFIENKIIKDSKAVLLDGEGIDLEKFSPQAGGKRDSFTFLYVGRMLKEKGIVEFVEAASSIKTDLPQGSKVNFQMLGFCGSDSPSMIDIDTMNTWVKAGYVDYLGTSSDVRPYIANCDCVILPSFYREGIPRILLEASAMCKPIITTDNVGCREVVIEDLTGYVCEPQNVESLKDVMLKMQNIPESRRVEMGEKGREYMKQRFDVEITIEKYMSLMGSLINPAASLK